MIPLGQLVDLPISLLVNQNHSYTHLKHEIPSAQEALELLIKYVLLEFLFVSAYIWL